MANVRQIDESYPYSKLHSTLLNNHDCLRQEFVYLRSLVNDILWRKPLRAIRDAQNNLACKRLNKR